MMDFPGTSLLVLDWHSKVYMGRSELASRKLSGVKLGPTRGKLLLEESMRGAFAFYAHIQAQWAP